MIAKRRARMNILDKFTDKALDAVREALNSAKAHNNGQVEAEHMLDALLKQEGGVAQQIVQKAGSDVTTAQRMVENEIGRLPRVYGASDPGLSPQLRAVI